MTRATFSEELRLKVQFFRGRLSAATEAFWAQEDVVNLFPGLLFRVHSIVRASVPVMEAALARSESLAAKDAASPGLAAYLRRHIPEEHNHAEWLLDDMAVLGMKREATWTQMPSPTVAALVGAQYYWIHHYHPAAILGYIAVLEGDPPTVDGVESMIEKTGLPRDAFRNYFRHARLDVRHSEDLNRLLDELPLDDSQKSVIGVNAGRTLDLLAQSVEELLELHRLGCPAFGAMG